MDKLIFDRDNVKVYVHDEDDVEVYAECPICHRHVRIFFPIPVLAEILASARSFMAGIFKPKE